jgi:hypothetical protein
VFESGCEWNDVTPKNASKNGHLECFKYSFERWNDHQEFWNIEYNLTKIIDEINLDDPVWRRLFTIDLSKHPNLQEKVESKKKEIEKLKEASKEVLESILPMDVIKYCIHTYF